MKLAELMPEPAEINPQFSGLEIAGLAVDSRKLNPGELFVAVSGTKTDGLRFVAEALDRGAAAIVAEQVPPVALPERVAFIRVADARRTLALLAAKWFPRQPQQIAAVTGTSGKTSVAAFARQVFESLGRRAASIGTLGLFGPGLERCGSLTTPDPIELHRTLDRLVAAGITHAVIEASSHGLDQRRLDGLRIGIGAFTNLSRDHLDYHPSVAAYLAAKLRLFENLVPPGGTAVVNADHEPAKAVLAAASRRHLRILTVGRTGHDIQLAAAAVDGHGHKLKVSYQGRDFAVALPLLGDFQIENALIAAAMVIASGEEAGAAFAALEKLQGAKGRLELVGRKDGGLIFVDYAHKPDALAKALAALRPHARRRLIAVFGAGGDRDPGKRPMMGAIAAKIADAVIITDDNPRSEDPAAIRAAILAGAPGAAEIPDRRQAIAEAIAGLAAGDVLLIAGKGHESGQIIGDRVLPFSDHEAVATALQDVQ